MTYFLVISLSKKRKYIPMHCSTSCIAERIPDTPSLNIFPSSGMYITNPAVNIIAHNHLATLLFFRLISRTKPIISNRIKTPNIATIRVSLSLKFFICNAEIMMPMTSEARVNLSNLSKFGSIEFSVIKAIISMRLLRIYVLLF